MERRAARQVRPLDEHDILPAETGQPVQDRAAAHTAADDDSACTGLHPASVGSIRSTSISGAPYCSVRPAAVGLKQNARDADICAMRHVPRWLKILGLASLIAEAGAAAAVFWHSR